MDTQTTEYTCDLCNVIVDNGEGHYLGGDRVCGNCAEKYAKPIQYHYVLVAEKTDAGTKWSVTVDTRLLQDGNIFNPNEPFGLGWSMVETDEEFATDAQFVQELVEKLNADLIC